MTASAAVAIRTPSSNHVDLILAAAVADKSTFYEKPISLDLAEVDPADRVRGGRPDRGHHQP